MNCFYFFREKSGTKEGKSLPVSCNPSNQGSKSSNSAAKRTTTSKTSNSEVNPASTQRSIPALYEERAHNLRVFTFSDLRSATNDFSRLLKIGEGGFGSVYKGFIKPVDGSGDRTVVAVKKLNNQGLQGHKEWVAEVQFLGVVDHPNLVKLLGYCAVDGERGIQRLLVYEFMANKSLEDHLFSRALPALPWHIRLQIALGAAQGLVYLHEELEVQVIYRDFKASNVLLDEDFNPKLSDFGLAREGPTAGHTHVSTAVVGTYGYAAPDYIQTGHLTSKSDVWSFGVVLYEILTGRRIFERNRPTSEQRLLEWVKQYPPNSKKFFRIMDPRLERKYSLAAALSIAKLADTCLAKYSKDRPKMSDVVEKLKLAIQISETGNDHEMNSECSEFESETDMKPPDQVDGSDYSRRQMDRLVKLRQHGHGIGKQRFLLTQKTTVP